MEEKLKKEAVRLAEINLKDRFEFDRRYKELCRNGGYEDHELYILVELCYLYIEIMERHIDRRKGNEMQKEILKKLKEDDHNEENV